MIRHIEEREAIAVTGHEYGCFEIFAEELVEAGQAETGAMDELLDDGREVIEHYLDAMDRGGCRRECGQVWTAADLAEIREMFRE